MPNVAQKLSRYLHLAAARLTHTLILTLEMAGELRLENGPLASQDFLDLVVKILEETKDGNRSIEAERGRLSLDRERYIPAITHFMRIEHPKVRSPEIRMNLDLANCFIVQIVFSASRLPPSLDRRLSPAARQSP